MEYNDVARFSALFGGRNDAVFDGAVARRRKPTFAIFDDHLSGRIDGIGTYPIREDNRCKWGCIDLDGAEYTFERTLDVYACWQYYSITAWIERSRSKGWHLWTFASEWISAETMRYAGLQVIKLAKLPESTEVNPKQTTLAPGQIGNTVRLPYPGNSNWQRQVVLEPSSALVLSLPDFLSCAMGARSPATAFDVPAGIYRQALLTERRTERYSSLLSKSTSLPGSTRNQEAYKVLTGAMRVSINRDNQLFTVANLMHGLAMPYDEALTRMEEIWKHQVDQSHDFYSLNTALAKVKRAYK